jgi:TolB protein
MTPRPLIVAALLAATSAGVAPATGDASQSSSASATTVSPVVSRFAFPGRNGRIVFADTVGPGQFGSDVFTVHPDGTGRRRLTFSMATSGPQWAPFGHRILFGAIRGTGTDLWVMDHRGRHKHRLLRAGSFTDLEAAWAPGGHRLVVARNGEGVSRLLVYSFETKVATPVTPNAAFVDSPAWSPNGRRIVFRRQGLDGARTDLFSIRPNGTDLTRLTFTPTPDLIEVGPNWSPDGSRILFSRGVFEGPSCSPLFTIRPDGTGLTRLHAGCRWSEAAWSPNGRKIVASRDTPRRSRLWTMSADGSSRSFLVTGSSPDWQPKR